MKITWLGHSAFHLDTGSQSILLDPFFEGNPTYQKGFEDALEKVDVIALTHGHDDHVGDTLRLAKKYGSTLFAQFELAMYLNGQGIEKVQPMNTGGCVAQDGVAYCMVQAFHSSGTMIDGRPVTMGDPAGFVVKAGDARVYAAGDTGLFSDMALIQRVHRPNVGFIPVGDRFTMGPEQAAIACNEFLDLDLVVPVHWGTFDMLTGDPEDFKRRVTKGRVHIATPGEPFDA